jgi:protein TonB
MLIKKVNPKYPADLRRKHVQGTVILRAEIGTDGAIHSLTVVSGEPSLVKAALKAVKQWRYKPYIVDGKTTAVETEIKLNFALDQG